jgi:3-vinyl bacteriochlorophyllide hydratase
MDAEDPHLVEARTLAVRAKRSKSVWTIVHPLFAIGQMLAFFVSVGLLIAYSRGLVDFHVVHVSVLVKIGLMVGAVVTGALWEHDVFGYYWFAPEFLIEDVMTLVVFIFQLSYLAMVALHPGDMPVIILMLVLAYTVYAGNVAQYIHRTQNDKKKAQAAQAHLDALELAA